MKFTRIPSKRPSKAMGLLLAHLFLGFFLGPGLFAQSIGEARWTPPGTQTELTAFMVFESESHAFIRVAYESEGSKKIIHVDHEIIVGRNGEQNYYIMKGISARFIAGPSAGGYTPDHFVWVWTDDMAYYDLPYTSDKEVDADVSDMQQVTAYRKLVAGSVTDDYLLQFFLPQEVEYLRIRQVLGLEPKNSDDIVEQGANTTLHLIVVANTAITDIGPSCQIDKRSIIAEMEGVCASLGMRLKKYVLEEGLFSKAKLTSTLTEFSPKPQDVVFFLYRGHGFRWSDQTEPFPNLDLRTTNYARLSTELSVAFSEISQVIAAKGARLNLLFADCCNSDIGVSQVTAGNFMQMQGNEVNYSDRKLARLFLHAKGTLVAAAASPGEPSFTSNYNGGFFTSALILALHQEISFMGEGDATWEELVQNTIQSAKYKSSRFMCPNCTEQHGIHDIKIDYTE